MTYAQHFNSLHGSIDNIGWERTSRTVNISLNYLHASDKNKYDTLVQAWTDVIRTHHSKALVP